MTRDRLLTSGQLARELGISHQSITNYARNGQLEPTLVTPGGHYRWDLEDVKQQLRTKDQQRRERD
ncbi:DNA-binding transcriptional MerR regulator [Saccharopolyspora lacisalsi]|uniref:DNA-binding transcriptional MerR regulator n=1 Tax=Halosaccharopolyspora lacisalsi TaxID=1000566 RepID=A0A839DZD5_9PSEU|nr:helix-turn-helix domain-containing protein [Halosaccharopolyspora lacisalsi]MBA8824581.1 DNA-binding transcriptional MerR regulator [Halosaccharopolyspora lacisalsi]